MSSKTIIFKVPEFPHLSETFIVAQILTAIKLGYEVKIMTRRIIDNDAFSLIFDEYDLQGKLILEDFKIPKNKIRRVFKWLILLFQNAGRIDSLLKFHGLQRGFSLTWMFQWHFFMRYNKVSCFHVQYGTNASSLSLLKSISAFKPSLIVTFHGHDAFFPINGYIPNNGYYDKLFINADLITANTLYLRDQLLKLNCPPEKLSIIPVGVDTRFFTPSHCQDAGLAQLRLLSVGRLDGIKGHRYCIETVRKLVRKNVDVVLTIVGEGEERNALEQMITAHGLEKNVFLLGGKNLLEVREQFWQSHIYMLLAVPVESGRRETQGLATLEAQACGLPVVAFDSGGVKYTVDNGVSGFVLGEYDVEGVVSKIEYLYNNRDQLLQMSNAATKFVEEKYAQVVIDQLWKTIYGQLIEKGEY